jgi:hypothetical protein
VISRSGKVDTSCAGSVLLRDIADVKRLKQEDSPNLVTQGSTELVHALLANDLVDAMSIFTVPVVLGGGKKLFADGSAPHSFKLTRSRVSPNGLIIGHYEREGEIKIDDAMLNSPRQRDLGGAFAFISGLYFRGKLAMCPQLCGRNQGIRRNQAQTIRDDESGRKAWRMCGERHGFGSHRPCRRSLSAAA